MGAQRGELRRDRRSPLTLGLWLVVSALALSVVSPIAATAATSGPTMQLFVTVNVRGEIPPGLTYRIPIRCQEPFPDGQPYVYNTMATFPSQGGTQTVTVPLNFICSVSYSIEGDRGVFLLVTDPTNVAPASKV